MEERNKRMITRIIMAMKIRTLITVSSLCCTQNVAANNRAQ